MQTEHLDPDFAVGPQIRVADVADLRDAGFGVVIGNRPDGEEPGQVDAASIRAACEAAGIAFHHLPISGGEIPAQTLEAFRRVLASANTPVFAFCRSGQRSRLLYRTAKEN